ncbi:MAG: glycogen/starch/alpha-glucan phosphorylase [Sedimentisphaerales bacterium]|nr:glycogen/starch/alpha-glucan phosphorylase [Sedimentisphaerales bacterium]
MFANKKELSKDSRKRAPATGVRTGSRVEDIKRSFLDNLFCSIGRVPRAATHNDLYTALALTVRDRVLKQGVRTLETYTKQDARVVAYLSAEFLPGPHLANNLLNLGIIDQTRQAMTELGVNLDELYAQEEEPGLGNGGLGRLASCYLDSLASLEIPAIGYGIRYEFGIFDQIIRDGWQVEITDKWLRFGNPWEIMRPELAFDVPFGGRTENWVDAQGRYRVRWVPDTVVKGVAYDTPILGYRVGTCNRLRLWKAEAVESFDFAAFNHGDYYRAVEDKMVSENITKVLYPNDEHGEGKTLRLQQQFFFVTCSLQDMIRIHTVLGRPLEKFHTRWAVQLNDTHPAIAVAEMMRLLVDKNQMDWDTAWEVTRHTFNFTNHTLLPEALETWPIPLFSRLLPRHLQIIYTINHRFLQDVRAQFPHDEERVRRMSLIGESGDRSVRMANLAAVGSHRINGVAELHTSLLKQNVMSDFAEMWPGKFCNVTNGVTPRRFIAISNPSLAQLLSDRIGAEWLWDLDQLRKLETFADDTDFQQQWRDVKHIAKCRLAELIKQRVGVTVDPTSLFDIQAKRIHEYKRQHLKVVFFPDYNVKNAQPIYPAADLSEQISMAGKEASGTGNMKFSLNGALTIGTLDGANVEIREEVGSDNFFLFGLTVDQVRELKACGYNPRHIYEQDAVLREVLDFVTSDALTGGDKNLFQPLIDNLLRSDPFLVLADYRPYVEGQAHVSTLWNDPQTWTRRSIINVARMGKFSSDRSIHDYCRQVWQVQPMHVRMEAIEPHSHGD